MDLTKKCARCGFALGHHSAGNESFCPEKVKGECRFSKNKFEPRGEQGGLSSQEGRSTSTLRSVNKSPRNPESFCTYYGHECKCLERKKEGLK